MIRDFLPKCDIFGQMLGFGLDTVTNSINNRISEGREQYARLQNYELGERAAENADARTRALYNDLQSPKAIMQQLKEAGLSPSLMYGGELGGTIGQGAQGGGAAGIAPNVYGLNAMEAAQVGLINAETNKTKAETENIETNTDKQKAECDNIVQNTKNAALAGVYQELQNTLAQMDVNLKGTYAEEQIKTDLERARTETNNLAATLQSLKAKGKIDEASADAIIQYNRNRLIEQTANIFLKHSQAKLAQANINLTNTQVEKLFNDILVANNIVEVAKRKVTVDENKLKEQVKQWSVENNLKQKEINVQLAGEIMEFYNGAGANAVRAIDALIPF